MRHVRQLQTDYADTETLAFQSVEFNTAWLTPCTRQLTGSKRQLTGCGSALLNFCAERWTENRMQRLAS